MKLDMEFVRAQFPALEGQWTFFDNAGGSQILKRSVDRIAEFLLTRNVQTGGTYEPSVKAREAVEESRRAMASLVNANRPEEIVMGHSTTVLVQNLARAMRGQFALGDEVIICDADHESNIGPWLQLAEYGVTVKIWHADRQTGELDLADLAVLLSPRTKIVAIAHVSNILGTVNPIKEITRMAHAVDARVCVDGVAYAPHRAIDVQDWDVDFYVFSLYKTFGPHHAVMYGKYDALLGLDGLYHYFYGREMVPMKLEPGNVNYELSFGAIGIVDYLAELGRKAGSAGSTRDQIVAAYSAISAHETALGQRLLDWLRERNDCRIIGRPIAGVDRVPTIAFTVDGHISGDITRAVDAAHIGIRHGDFHARRLVEAMDLTECGGVVRVSMAHYNTLDEVDALIGALSEVIGS